jgi:hypothetical protein
MKALVVLITLALLCACDQQGSGGPAEKAGRSLDKAMGKAGQAVEKAGRDMQDASKGKDKP